MAQVQRLSQAERTEISDARMLETAIRLIVERGPENTTLKEVGELAGYSRGLAGYRFGNKAGLFEFVVRSVGDEWLQELKAATAGKSGYDAIAAATDAHYQMCEQSPDHLAAFYILWFGAIGPQSDVKQVISGIHDRRRRDVVRWVQRGVEDGSVAASVNAEAIGGQYSASIVGILYQWLVTPDDLPAVKALFENLKETVRLWLNPDAT